MFRLYYQWLVMGALQSPVRNGQAQHPTLNRHGETAAKDPNNSDPIGVRAAVYGSNRLASVPLELLFTGTGMAAEGPGFSVVVSVFVLLLPLSTGQQPLERALTPFFVFALLVQPSKLPRPLNSVVPMCPSDNHAPCGMSY